LFRYFSHDLLRPLLHSYPITISFFFNLPAPPQISTLSLHDALPISRAVTTPASSCPGIDGVRSRSRRSVQVEGHVSSPEVNPDRSEEHTSELQSLTNLVCRLLLEKKKKHRQKSTYTTKT